MTSAIQILSEAVDIPGYGEILDPARLPPYTEDLGGGVTHEVAVSGIERWTLNGLLHRDGDLPAVMDRFRMSWYRDGKLHRDGDKPAVIYSNGVEYWYKHGKRHRDGDKPALVYSDGTEEYWIGGEWVPKP